MSELSTRHMEALRRPSPPELSVLRVVAAVGSGLLIGYFIYAFLMGMEPITTVLALGLLCIFLVTFVYLVVYPDSLRSQYTERSLAIASDMMEDIREGLNAKSAEAICRRLLPETRRPLPSRTRSACWRAQARLPRNFHPARPSMPRPRSTPSSMASTNPSDAPRPCGASPARCSRSLRAS